MKKLFLFLLMFMMAACTALAEVQVESMPLEKTIFLSRGTNCYYIRSGSGYVLCDASGNTLSDAYGDLISMQYGHYYEYPGSGLNHIGLLDAQGKKLCDPMYGDVSYLDDDWILGFVLEPTTDANGDYNNRTTGEQYMVQRTDVMYKGSVIGSLTRTEFDPGWRCGVAGSYLYVRQTTSTGFWIDRSFNITRVEKDFSPNEFSAVYKKGAFHNPTQQYAYCAGCTLTADDVSAPVWYDDYNHRLVDLQGNLIKENVIFDSARAYGDYFLVRRDGLYGVMDMQGNVIVEPVYDDIGYSDGLFTNDYLTALTPEGHLHFVNRQGEVTARAEYELTSSNYKGFLYSSDFVAVNNMGKYIVFTAEKGELPVKYEDVSTPQNLHNILLVQKDGLWGAIDVQGNTVLPFIHPYAPEISNDGTLVYGRDDARNYILYRLTFPEAAPASTPVPGQPAAPAADDASWTCTCGASCTGKFCPECGSAKPAETAAPVADGSWTCSCGSVNTGKFCPECGTARPAAKPKCASCGYEPESDAPKFCPECGSKF